MSPKFKEGQTVRLRNLVELRVRPGLRSASIGIEFSFLHASTMSSRTNWRSYLREPKQWRALRPGPLGGFSNTELVLSADLFEQLHLRSPVQRVPPPRAVPDSVYPFFCEGGPKQNAELGSSLGFSPDGLARPADERSRLTGNSEGDLWG